jgi:hypothetical protein
MSPLDKTSKKELGIGGRVVCGAQSNFMIKYDKDKTFSQGITPSL